MRYSVVQDNNQWWVKDTRDGVDHGPYELESIADSIQSQLEASPPADVKSQEWVVATAESVEDREDKLQCGFEPFAFADGTMYFRKPSGILVEAIDNSDSSTLINPFAGGYTDVYTYTGAGQLQGFVLDFGGSKNVYIRLEIDGIQAWEIQGDLLYSLVPASNIDNADAISIRWDPTNAILFYKPHCCTFKSSIKIQAKADDATATRGVSRYIVDIKKRG